MTPATPAATQARMSSRLATPPEATTATPASACSAAAPAASTPLNMPSRATSVYSTSRTPASLTRRATSAAFIPEPSSQPATLTSPLRASMPQRTRPGNLSQAWRTRSSRSTAAVPSTTAATPSPSTRSMSGSDRSPPPSSISSPFTLQSSVTVARLTGWPALAPSRSTTWSTVAPAAANFSASSAGRRE